MTARARVTEVSGVPDVGSYLFTARKRSGDEEEKEVILVRCEGGGPVKAWKNACQHETDQRLDGGIGNGAVMRDGGIDDDVPGSPSHLTF